MKNNLVSNELDKTTLKIYDDICGAAFVTARTYR